MSSSSFPESCMVKIREVRVSSHEDEIKVKKGLSVVLFVFN